MLAPAIFLVIYDMYDSFSATTESIYCYTDDRTTLLKLLIPETISQL